MVSTQPFFQSSAMKIHDLTTKMMAKMPRITRNCESRVSMHDVQSALDHNGRIQLTQPDESSNSIFQETGFLACSSSRIPYRTES